MVRGQINDELNTLTLTWSCTDLSTNKLCLQYDGQDLFLDDFTYTIQLSEQSLSPLRSYLFEVTIKGELEAKHSVVLYASQVPLSPLNLELSTSPQPTLSHVYLFSIRKLRRIHRFQRPTRCWSLSRRCQAYSDGHSKRLSLRNGSPLSSTSFPCC